MKSVFIVTSFETSIILVELPLNPENNNPSSELKWDDLPLFTFQLSWLYFSVSVSPHFNVFSFLVYIIL